MKKSISISMLAIFSLVSAVQANPPVLNDGKEILSQHPMSADNRSKEYGGSKDAIDAYSDGVGVYIGAAKSDKQVNQKPMAELVNKYGDTAKAKGITVKEEVAFGNISTSADKALLSKVMDTNMIYPDGSSCDDGNIQTINDKYLNAVCMGINIEGQICNDNNSQTINDKYVNGICIGTNVEGQSCNDNNAQTISDLYVNGVCIGTNVEGNICNDNNVQTINDKYVNGICAGTNVEGTSCSDGNMQTISDIYTNGVCSGINVEGTTCNDGNTQTINDIYRNGVCGVFGKNFKYVKTMATSFVNGVMYNTPNIDYFCGTLKIGNEKTINPSTINISLTATGFATQCAQK